MSNISNSGIVAQAFRFMAVTPPSSSEDDTQKAQDAAQQYPEALRQMLETYDWSFASTLADLPALSAESVTAVDADLPYIFRLPGSLVRLHEVGGMRTRFRVDADVLRADEPAPLRIRYTALLDNENKLPSSFKLACSLRLARLLGPMWGGGSASSLESLAQQEAAALREAKRQDASMASDARYDDLAQAPDWVTEATR
jgi:hypothetical protein